MTVDEELTITAEIVRLNEVAEALRDMAADLESDARHSTKHGPEFDYIATRLAEIAKECEEYEIKFEEEAK